MATEDIDAVSPAALEALYATGHWLHSHGRFAEASDVFRAMIFLASGDERGWLGLGACHEAFEQEEIALELYVRAAEAACAPRCGIARARLLRKHGLDEEARAAFDDAARLASEDQDPWLRSLALQERGS